MNNLTELLDVNTIDMLHNTLDAMEYLHESAVVATKEQYNYIDPFDVHAMHDAGINIHQANPITDTDELPF